MSLRILRSIASSVRGAYYFSVMVDECIDVSNHEQLTYNLPAVYIIEYKRIRVPVAVAPACYNPRDFRSDVTGTCRSDVL